jgi:hypothetical protein
MVEPACRQAGCLMDDRWKISLMSICRSPNVGGLSHLTIKPVDRLMVELFDVLPEG